MGIFDSVYFKCPSCGHKMEAQSQGGPGEMDIYEPNAVPLDVAIDLHIYYPCKCGKKYRIKETPIPLVSVEIYESETDYGDDVDARFAEYKAQQEKRK